MGFVDSQAVLHHKLDEERVRLRDAVPEDHSTELGMLAAAVKLRRKLVDQVLLAGALTLLETLEHVAVGSARAVMQFFGQ